jgi:hypothetical protein
MRENQHLGDVFDAHTDAEFKTRDIETGAEQDARLIDPDLLSNTADPKRLAGTPYGRFGCPRARRSSPVCRR